MYHVQFTMYNVQFSFGYVQFSCSTGFVIRAALAPCSVERDFSLFTLHSSLSINFSRLQILLALCYILLCQLLVL